VPPLGHDGHVGVALQEDGEAGRLVDPLGEGHIPPALEIRRRDHHARPRVERTGCRDAEADRIGQPGILGGAPDVVRQAADAMHDGVYTLLIVGIDCDPRRECQIWTQIRGANAGTAQVDRQDRLGGRLIHRGSHCIAGETPNRPAASADMGPVDARPGGLREME
jgi:hypothetical protein